MNGRKEVNTEKAVEDHTDDEAAPGNDSTLIEDVTDILDTTETKGAQDAIDMINNNNNKNDLKSASPEPENQVKSGDEADRVPSGGILSEPEPLDDIDGKEDNIDGIEEETAEADVECNAVGKTDDAENNVNEKTEEDKVVDSSFSSVSESEDTDDSGANRNAGGVMPKRITALQQNSDSLSAAASEEDNAVSGTESGGGVSTPAQRRHSEIHLGEPDMLKEAIQSSLKEVLSSAGSDSETTQEFNAAFRRSLFQKQVSETLITEIEEIVKEKILENFIDDEVAAITDNGDAENQPDNKAGSSSNKVQIQREKLREIVQQVNSAEQAYWNSEANAKQDPYVISVESSKYFAWVV